MRGMGGRDGVQLGDDGIVGVVGRFFDLCVLLLLWSTAVLSRVVGVVGQLLLLYLLLSAPLCHRLAVLLSIRLFLLSARRSQQIAQPYRACYARYACDDSAEGRGFVGLRWAVGWTPTVLIGTLTTHG